MPSVPKQVRHRRRAYLIRRAQRQAADCPDLLLELRSYKRLDRQVARVVRPRRKFIHQQAALAIEKELHAQNADKFELPGDFGGNFDGFAS